GVSCGGSLWMLWRVLGWLQAQGGVGAGTMDGLMPGRGPAGALLEALEEERVVRVTDQNHAPADPLEMIFKTKVGVAGSKELGVDRTVRGVTDRTSFADGLVFEHVQAALRRMAPEAAFVG